MGEVEFCYNNKPAYHFKIFLLASYICPTGAKEKEALQVAGILIIYYIFSID